MACNFLILIVLLNSNCNAQLLDFLTRPVATSAKIFNQFSEHVGNVLSGANYGNQDLSNIDGRHFFKNNRRPSGNLWSNSNRVFSNGNHGNLNVQTGFNRPWNNKPPQNERPQGQWNGGNNFGRPIQNYPASNDNLNYIQGSGNNPYYSQNSQYPMEYNQNNPSAFNTANNLPNQNTQTQPNHLQPQYLNPITHIEMPVQGINIPAINKPSNGNFNDINISEINVPSNGNIHESNPSNLNTDGSQSLGGNLPQHQGTNIADIPTTNSHVSTNPPQTKRPYNNTLEEGNGNSGNLNIETSSPLNSGVKVREENENTQDEDFDIDVRFNSE